MSPNPTIEIGPLTVHLYGIIIALAIYAGWLLAKKRAHLYKIPQKLFDDPVILIPLILGIAGARIYHVIDYWSVYRQDLISTLFIQNGGLGIWGGILGALLGFYVIANLKKLDILTALDLVAPSLLLGQIIGRLGNFVNQEGFGPPTRLPWAIFINPQNRPPEYQTFTHFHPTFFYEAILNAIFLIILLRVSPKLKGQTFALYLIFYSATRFLVEFLRIDTWQIAEIKIAQVISILVFSLGVYLFVRHRNRHVRLRP